MPKVYTYNAEFNPISFADRIAPMKLYKEEYDKQQAAYEKMLEETDDLGVLKDIAMDADSYGVYKSFQDELNSIADEMSTKGLSTDIRNRLLKLKRRQANEINPLLERQKSRADLIKEQRKYLETHPNGMFDIDYDSVPLSKITSSSTYKPYDLGKDYASIADAIYSNIRSNNGVDTTNYDNIRNQYDYENLSQSKKKHVDDIINLARNKAAAVYMKEKSDEALSYAKIKKSGSNSGSGTTDTQLTIEDVLSGKHSGKFKLPGAGGFAIDVNVDKSGNITVGNKSYTTGKRKDGETDEEYSDRIGKELFSYNYGADYEELRPLPNGTNVLIMSSTNNGKKQYYIINNKNKVTPVPDIENSTLMQQYAGEIYNYMNGQHYADVNLDMISDNNSKYDSSKHELDTIKSKTYSSISELAYEENKLSTKKSILRKLGIEGDNPDKLLSDFFDNGYKIKRTPIIKIRKEKDKDNDDAKVIVGYRYEVVAPGRPTID